MSSIRKCDSGLNVLPVSPTRAYLLQYRSIQASSVALQHIPGSSLPIWGVCNERGVVYRYTLRTGHTFLIPGTQFHCCSRSPGVVFLVPATYPFQPMALACCTALDVTVATPLQREITLSAVRSPWRISRHPPVTLATATLPFSTELVSICAPSCMSQSTFKLAVGFAVRVKTER